MARRGLAVDCMTNRQLYDRAITTLGQARWIYVDSIKIQDALLEEVESILKELQLRGEQLPLLPD